MAIIKIKPIKNNVKRAIDYIENDKKTKNEFYGTKREDLLLSLEYIEKDFKTQNKEFVSTLNCSKENPYNQMQKTKEIFNKKDKILAFHIIQSFDEEEVTPELAHKIGVEFAKELFEDRFEVVIATHLNTKHYHNHIIVNSVSFKDGKKYYDNHENMSIMRKINDNLCSEYGLKITKEKSTSKHKINYQHYYNNYEMKNNYKNSTKHDIDIAIKQAYSFIDFKELLDRMNYDVMIRYGKISVRERSYKRNIRIERAFGEEYSIDNIKRRILEEQAVRVPFIECYKFKKPNIYNKYCKRNYKKSASKKGSLTNLYHHYCYLLKIYKNNNRPLSRKVSIKLQAEVDRMNYYSNLTRFLDKNKINTNEDLEKFKEDKLTCLESFVLERKNLWRLKKKESDPIKIEEYSLRINQLAELIKLLKDDIQNIEDIENETARIENQVKEVQEIRKESKQRKLEKERRLYL